MDKGRIMIVEDEASILDLLADYLTASGYEVGSFLSSEDALIDLKKNQWHVMITDLMMPRVDGLQLVKFIQQEYLSTLGIVVTGYGSLESAVRALRYGAFDYILKPFKLDEVLTTVDSAMNYYRLVNLDNIPKKLMTKGNLLRRFAETKMLRENTLLRGLMRDKYKFENIVGVSFPMQKVFELIEKVADTNATVLITGESGVGKELVARAIHFNSSRMARPLVVVNCGAIPEELLESELFGHEKGAFTGAIKTRFGRFELADGGTIFLDEIGDMSLNLQVKLLLLVLLDGGVVERLFVRAFHALYQRKGVPRIGIDRLEEPLGVISPSLLQLLLSGLEKILDVDVADSLDPLGRCGRRGRCLLYLFLSGKRERRQEQCGE